MPFTKEEKYANFVSVFEGQVKTFEAAVVSSTSILFLEATDAERT